MKRTAIKRGTAVLARSPMTRSTKPVNQRSPKTRAVYAGTDGRAAFVAQTLAARPLCEIRSVLCGGTAIDVHESILRSRGGAIVPGLLAELQEQRFFAVCRDCHNWIHRNREVSEVRGFLDARHGSMIPSARDVEERDR